ncbi:MAG: hypothetical protein ACFBRM_12495 [Pikeienuella sp.]
MNTTLKTVLLAAISTGVLAGTVSAQEINFDGNVENTCTIKGRQDGTLGLSGDGLTLGSELSGATSGEVDVFMTGGNRLIFSAPTLDASPTGYTGAPTLEIKVEGGTYQTGQQSIDIAYPGATLAVDARATDTSPFRAGFYRVQTIVSCVPGSDRPVG